MLKLYINMFITWHGIRLVRRTSKTEKSTANDATFHTPVGEILKIAGDVFDPAKTPTLESVRFAIIPPVLTPANGLVCELIYHFCRGAKALF